jgi:nucleotide-binding universal stress UspA family protein
MYQKILVPIDGSEHSHYTLSQAIQLAELFGPSTKITVVHVSNYIPYSDLSMAIDMTRLLKDEGKAVLGVAEPLFASAKVAHDSLALEGDPAEEICKCAQRGGYDLIVIGNRGRGLFAELLLGSVSHKVIQHAPCPVFVVRKTA